MHVAIGNVPEKTAPQFHRREPEVIAKQAIEWLRVD
jgi:hypothetical protein